MKQLLERYPFFLVLLPAFVTIHLEKELHQVISYRFVYDRIVIFFAVPVLLFFIIFLFNRSSKKSAFSAFILSLVFFYTGDLKNLLTFKFPESIWQSYSFLMTLLIVVIAITSYMIQRSRSDFSKQFLIINTGLMLFIIADFALIAFNLNKGKYELVNEIDINFNPSNNVEKPDIYYLVFDTYTSSSLLQSDFSYSNKYIETDLRNKGFIIIPNSRSNYTYTSFSIGSTFNMNYIRNVDTINKTLDRQYLQSLKLVYSNRLISYFENEGYSVYNHSLFDFKSHPSTIKQYDNWGFRELFDQYNIFLKMYKEMGYHLPYWLKIILGKNKYFINDPLIRKKNDSLVNQYLLESNRLKISNPKFVYAHFIRPHSPYNIDSLGNFFEAASISKEEAYIHQIAYSNKIIKNVTDSIIANAEKPLAIIIQGDHGFPAKTPIEQNKMLSNFNAVYFSNKNYKLFNDSSTNVNTFRIVLNTFFKKDLSMLPGEFYIFK